MAIKARQTLVGLPAIDFTGTAPDLRKHQPECDYTSLEESCICVIGTPNKELLQPLELQGDGENSLLAQTDLPRSDLVPES